MRLKWSMFLKGRYGLSAGLTVSESLPRQQSGPVASPQPSIKTRPWSASQLNSQAKKGARPPYFRHCRDPLLAEDELTILRKLVPISMWKLLYAAQVETTGSRTLPSPKAVVPTSSSLQLLNSFLPTSRLYGSRAQEFDSLRALLQKHRTAAL